jgi:hypothetical protein
MPTKVEFRSQQYSRGHPRKRVAGCPDKLGFRDAWSYRSGFFFARASC